MGSVTVDEAWAVLGLDAATADATAVRRAYLAAVRSAHPDQIGRAHV